MKIGWSATGLLLAVNVLGCSRADTVDVGRGGGAILAAAATTTGCTPDKFFFFEGTGRVKVGNFVPDRSCRNELGVFRTDQALYLSVPTWTPTPRDRVNPIPETPRVLEVLVRIVPAEVESKKGISQTPGRIEADACRAHFVYNTMRCGMVVSVKVVPSHSEQSSALVYKGCDGMEAIKKQYGFTAGALNVYYTIGNGYYKGLRCGTNDFLLISRNGADNETLAHEIGHTLALGHFRGDMLNVMFSGHPTRTRLALGQCFRAHVDARSLGYEKELPGSHDCSVSSTTKTCPAEWWPAEAPAMILPDSSPIQRWLELEEATQADLDLVVALRQAAVDGLLASRRKLKDEVLEHLKTTYHQLRTYSDARKDAPLSLKEPEYVEIYYISAEVRWDVRVAIGLNALSAVVPDAAGALRQVLDSARPEARQQLEALSIR